MERRYAPSAHVLTRLDFRASITSPMKADQLSGPSWSKAMEMVTFRLRAVCHHPQGRNSVSPA